MKPEIEINYPEVEPDEYPFHIGDGYLELREYIYTGEHIADDPDEYSHHIFVNCYDIYDIIRAWCLCNGINPDNYPSLNTTTEKE